MKKYQVLSLAFLFSCFATSAIAQSQKEPVLHPIKKETIKVVTDDDKNWQPVKPSSSDPTKAKEPVKPEKQKTEKPAKPEKEKKEKPEMRKAERPEYINKGR